MRRRSFHPRFFLCQPPWDAWTKFIWAYHHLRIQLFFFQKRSYSNQHQNHPWSHPIYIQRSGHKWWPMVPLCPWCFSNNSGLHPSHLEETVAIFLDHDILGVRWRSIFQTHHWTMGMWKPILHMYLDLWLLECRNICIMCNPMLYMIWQLIFNIDTHMNFYIYLIYLIYIYTIMCVYIYIFYIKTWNMKYTHIIMYTSVVGLTHAMGPKVPPLLRGRKKLNLTPSPQSQPTNYSFRTLDSFSTSTDITDFNHQKQLRPIGQCVLGFVIVCQLDMDCHGHAAYSAFNTSQQEHLNFWNTVGTQTLSTYSLTFSSIKDNNNNIIKKAGTLGWHDYW